MRQTSAEIDAGILDVAAGIFAQSGYDGTSIQKIADAVGYSKTGLLHRFPSKEKLFRATVAHAFAVADEILDEVDELPAGEVRNRALFERAAERALDHPGLVRLLFEAFKLETDLPDVEEIQLEALRLVALLEVPLDTPAERLRLTLALQLMVNAVAPDAQPPFDVEMRRDQLVAFTVDLTLHTLYAPISIPA